MVTNRIHDLIEKYVDGSASEAEREELLAWYRSEADQVSEWPFTSPEEKTLLQARMLHNLQRHIGGAQPRRRYPFLKYAAAIAVLALCACVLKLVFLKPASRQEQTVTTQYNERKNITLPDSTKVWLGPHSTVRYTFTSTSREVHFEGEAFFDVAPDANSTFVIHTGELATKVLGTSFNITAYNDDSNIRITLLSGALMLAKGRREQRLQPNEQGIFSKKEGTIATISYPDAALMLLRREGILEYKNTTVANVAIDLEHLFGIKVTPDKTTGNCLFYGRLKAGEDIEAFLTKLCLVINARWTKEGDQYRISRGNC